MLSIPGHQFKPNRGSLVSIIETSCNRQWEDVEYKNKRMGRASTPLLLVYFMHTEKFKLDFEKFDEKLLLFNIDFSNRSYN